MWFFLQSNFSKPSLMMSRENSFSIAISWPWIVLSWGPTHILKTMVQPATHLREKKAAKSNWCALSQWNSLAMLFCGLRKTNQKHAQSTQNWVQFCHSGLHNDGLITAYLQNNYTAWLSLSSLYKMYCSKFSISLCVKGFPTSFSLPIKLYPKLSKESHLRLLVKRHSFDHTEQCHLLE